MHGYELNRVLEEREVRDWAGISRPQVYYSLRKLETLGFIRPVDEEPASHGPERRTYATTEKGFAALRAGLARQAWTLQRPPPPFLTWLALSTHAARGTVRRQLERRREFLETELARERVTLKSIRADEGEMVRVAELMVELTIQQFQTELRWLAGVGVRLGISP